MEGELGKSHAQATGNLSPDAINTLTRPYQPVIQPLTHYLFILKF